jgi:predicted GIY-YIG superfamily endonuclease
MKENFPNFDSILAEMSTYQKQLKTIERKEISKVLKKKKGVYVFLEKDIAVYIGKTDDLGRRLSEHVRAGSKNNDANFAYKLAKLEWKQNNKTAQKITRKILEATESFKPHFDKAKKSVADMQMQFVVINDPYHQYLFEFWLAIKLKTKHNQFANT